MSCARCNGADNKGAKDVVLGHLHLPHLNNTLISVSYGEGGFVQPNVVLLSNRALENAEALINLIGLDKRPGHPGYKSKDKRWDRRREVWELAKRYLDKYAKNEVNEQIIVDLARGYGFWSVWFNVFNNFVAVKQLLVQSFRGTAEICFDENWNLVPRNPGNLTDPT